MRRAPGAGPRPAHPAPTVTDSLDRVVDAAQNVVVDHIQLVRLEVQTAVRGALQSGVLFGVGSWFLALAWVIGLMAGFTLLGPRLGANGTLLVLAAVNLAVGAVLIAFGRRTVVREVRHGSA